MQHSRDEVIAAVEVAFPGRPSAEIMELLDIYGVESHERERERVQLAILKLSRGDDNKLLQHVDAAKTDYRDVLFWAETPDQSQLAEPGAVTSPPGSLQPMTPGNAIHVLAGRICESGMTIANLTLAQGLRLMLDFYRDVRGQDCVIEEDGDMLLLEWTDVSSSAGPVLRCGIARQFSVVAPANRGPEISQVLLSFHFPALTVAAAPANEEYWCNSPDALAEFEAAVRRSEIYRAVSAVRPLQVTLEYDEA